MEVVTFDELRSTSTGYFITDKKGYIFARGFADLKGKPVRFSTLEGQIILAHDEKEVPEDETVPFTSETLNSAACKNYLKQRQVFGHVFIKVFGLYVQTDLKLLPKIGCHT